jgi:hypothetical protein
MTERTGSARRRLILPFILAAAVAACQDSPFGPAPFDAEVAANAVDEALTSAQEAEDVLSAVESALDALDEFASSFESEAAPQHFGSRAYRFLQYHAGTTFVYDGEEGRYVGDPEATGAPANGVRFVLYAIDPAPRRPAEPLQPGLDVRGSADGSGWARVTERLGWLSDPGRRSAGSEWPSP